MHQLGPVVVFAEDGEELGCLGVERQLVGMLGVGAEQQVSVLVGAEVPGGDAAAAGRIQRTVHGQNLRNRLKLLKDLGHLHGIRLVHQSVHCDLPVKKCLMLGLQPIHIVVIHHVVSPAVKPVEGVGILIRCHGRLVKTELSFNCVFRDRQDPAHGIILGLIPKRHLSAAFVGVMAGHAASADLSERIRLVQAVHQ